MKFSRHQCWQLLNSRPAERENFYRILNMKDKSIQKKIHSREQKVQGNGFFNFMRIVELSCMMPIPGNEKSNEAIA